MWPRRRGSPSWTDCPVPVRLARAAFTDPAPSNPKAHHTARVARRHACLGHDTRSARSAFRRTGPRPCGCDGPRFARIVQNTRPRCSDTLSPASGHPPPSDGHERPLRATPRFLGSVVKGFRLRPAVAPNGPGKMFHFDFCNRLAKARAPSRIVRRSRCASSLARGRHARRRRIPGEQLES